MERALKLIGFLLAASLTACTSEHAASETGVMLRVSAAGSLSEDVAALRVRVYSGSDDDVANWPERADKTTDVGEWPAEVFIRATDPRRRWYAHVWGLDADGAEIAVAQAGGAFSAGTVRPWVVPLEACGEDGCGEPEPPEFGAGLEDGSVELPSEDAGGHGGGALDAGADASSPRDASTRRDASAADAADTFPMTDSGSPQDARVDPPGDAGSVGCDVNSCPSCLFSSSVRCCTSADQCGCALSEGAVCAESGMHENTCATTPAYATPDSCSQCICSKCASQVASCYGSDDSAKNAQCKAVRDCSETNRCASNACYCGSSPTCLFPDGACMQVVETAAGSAGPTAVQTASEDPESPVYRSNQVGTCSTMNCAAECGL